VDQSDALSGISGDMRDRNTLPMISMLGYSIENHKRAQVLVVCLFGVGIASNGCVTETANSNREVLSAPVAFRQ
jgi:hypothetical protein